MEKQLEIYHLNLEGMGQFISELKNFLSSNELERSRLFVFQKDRDQFILCRGALRQILSKYLACNPQDVHFEYTSKGKPRLNTQYHGIALHFNLSHTTNYALVAVAFNRQVGVDIEYQRGIENLDALMETSLSPQELRCIRFLPKERQIFAFLQYWTQKEAILKAWGIGLQEVLSKYEVGHWEELSLPIPITDAKGNIWTILNINSYIGAQNPDIGQSFYAGAVAYEGSNLVINHIQYIT